MTAGNITSNDPNKIIGGGNSTKDYKGDFGMAGTFYAGGAFSITGKNNQRIKGSVICQVFQGDKNNIHFVVDPDSPDFLPPHMPGTDIPPQGPSPGSAARGHGSSSRQGIRDRGRS